MLYSKSAPAAPLLHLEGAQANSPQRAMEARPRTAKKNEPTNIVMSSANNQIVCCAPNSRTMLGARRQNAKSTSVTRNAVTYLPDQNPISQQWWIRYLRRRNAIS